MRRRTERRIAIQYGWLVLFALVSLGIPCRALDSTKPLTAYARQTWRTENGLPQNTVRAIAQSPDGYIWIDTEGGIARFDGFTFVPEDPSKAPASLTTSPSIHERGILCRYADREGNIWIGTENGLSRIHGGNTEHFPPNDPLASETILAVFEDRQGNIWIGTDSDGLTILRNQMFTSYTTKDGLPSDVVRCVFQDRQGVIWAGTDDGLTRFENGRWSVLRTSNGLSSNAILSLAEDTGGSLLIGTPDGLNILQPNGRVKVITSADGLPDDLIRSIYTDGAGAIWLGTRRGLARLVDGQVTTYTAHEGLASDLVGAVASDLHGGLWIATFRGLSHFENGHFTNYASDKSSDAVTALWQDPHGPLWFGTRDGGLNRLDHGKIFRFPAAYALPADISAIVADKYQRLWLSSKSAVYRANINDLEAVARGASPDIPIAAFGVQDGLIVAEASDTGHPGAWPMRDGTLWFAMRKGIATVHPSQAAEASSASLPVVIESVLIDDKTVSVVRHLQVPPGPTRFAFEYAGLDYAAPHSVRYKYRLDGFDRGWINAGTRRTAYYTNLGPGNYRFRVLARTNQGRWTSSGADLSFHLEPHFYQTYWFYLLVLATLLWMAWQLYLWRLRRIKHEYDAVLAERNRIAREIHDTLAQGYVALSIQLELIGQALSISKESAQHLLEHARNSVQDGLAEARRSIWALRSQAAGSEDLPSKLSRIASQVNSTTGIKAQLQVFGTQRPLPIEVEEELAKIGQEAVTNVVRHAGAKNVKIDLSYQPKRLVLAVIDDGRGFSPPANGSGPEGHYGLRGMRERAEQIKAELTVKSAPGQGAQVLVQREI